MAVLLASAPVPGAGDGLLAAHMARHLLLLEVAPVLLLLVWRLRVPPVPAAVAGTVAAVAWHVPAAFDVAAARPAVHACEHLTFLVAGVALWAPVVHPRGGAAPALAYLVVTRSVQTVLGNVLLWWPAPLYASGRGLDDQRLAAAAMLGEGLVAGLAAAGVLFARLLREGHARPVIAAPPHRVHAPAAEAGARTPSGPSSQSRFV